MMPARALVRELIRAPAPRRALAALAAVAGIGSAAGGCGSSGSSGAGPTAAAPSLIATPPLTTDDAPVARVNGRTVWASCVAAQAGAITAGSEAERRAAALDQCIAFELLAQAAEARGLASTASICAANSAGRR